MPKPATSRLLAISFTMLFITACGGGGSGGGGPAPGPGQSREALESFATCDALHEAIVADAREKIALQADNLRADGFFLLPEPGGSPTPAAAQPTPAPGAEGPTPPEGDPDDFTDTNTQVPGVDEADVVETDGTHLYLLHGDALLILDSWPPETTAVRAELAIEGTPTGMFVADGRALVVSSVQDDGTLGGADACHVIGPCFPLTDDPLAGVIPSFPCFAPFTKLTLIDVAGEEPQVLRELYLEGYSVSARRHGDVARVVVQSTWGLPSSVPEAWTVLWGSSPPDSFDEYLRRLDTWQTQALDAITASTLDDWLPAAHERRAGALVALAPDCAAVHVPPPGLTGDGMTRIVALDMHAADAPIHDASIFGNAASVYASTDVLLLAQPDWSWLPGSGETTDRTAIHAFALASDPPATSYLASGFVPGTPLSQFAFDVQDDVIRVATTVRSSIGDPSVSRITTASIAGDTLVPLGATPDLAPGEDIRAVRFLGTRAYLVTFLQVDPLFVIDLSDPSAPRVLGEVELPGFSEYIHPLGPTHLLTIGQDVDPAGFVRGAALRIFDVSDPAAPRLTHMELLNGAGWTPAATDHLAFTFDASRGLLALPFSRIDGSYLVSLLLYAVDASAGFDFLAEIDHGHLAPELCQHGCAGLVQMRRGLFIDDFAYSISTIAVQAHALDDLTAPVATAELPALGSPPGGTPPIDGLPGTP